MSLRVEDTATPGGDDETTVTRPPLLAVLLAMAMFVFVIDTSFMNVSISEVVKDLDTTVSGVQAAIAVEALVSAAFILIGSKAGDLFGRKRAFLIGLTLYALGALSMVFAQGLAAVIVFWAVIGGLGASLYFPAMQSLIHGNFQGKMQAKVFAMIGAAGAVGAAVGPLIGGFVTTLLSWRVGFLIEAVIIGAVLAGAGLIKDAPFEGDRGVDFLGSLLSVLGMGGLVVGVLIWQEGGDWVGVFLAAGLGAMAGLVRWLRRRKAEAKPALFDPDLFKSGLFSLGITAGVLQQLALGGMLIALPIYLQLVLGYNALQAGLTLAPLSLTMFATSIVAGRRVGRRRPAALIRAGFAIVAIAMVVLIPLVPKVDTGWSLVIPLLLAGLGLGLLVSQINNYTLAPISEERVGEAAGLNSAAGSFGLSLGLAVAGATMLATLSIAVTQQADQSDVLPPADKQHIADVLEDDAQVMSDAQINSLVAEEPPETQSEILAINDDARNLALQVALALPLAASLLGLLASRRMLRLPDPAPKEDAGVALA
jgi:MFS family permease